MRLIREGIDKALEIVKSKNSLFEIIGTDNAYQTLQEFDQLAEIVTLHYPEEILKSFWENPEVVEYAILTIRLIHNGGRKHNSPLW